MKRSLEEARRKRKRNPGGQGGGRGGRGGGGGNNDTPSKKKQRIQKFEKAVAKAADAKAETMVAAAVASYEAEEQGDAKFDASLVSAIERMTDGASSSPKPDRKAKLASIAARLSKKKQ